MLLLLSEYGHFLKYLKLKKNPLLFFSKAEQLRMRTLNCTKIFNTTNVNAHSLTLWGLGNSLNVFYTKMRLSKGYLPDMELLKCFPQ